MKRLLLLLFIASAAAAAEAVRLPKMYFGDTTRNGRPFAKDPSVIRFDGRYLMYYSLPPSTNQASPAGWAVGIASSSNLVNWKKVAEITPQQPCERKGCCAPGARVLKGKVHLFYQTYGNGPRDAICHAVSADGIHFERDPSNPVFAPTGAWNAGRAIDAEVVPFHDQLLLFFATRDPLMKTQMLGVATAPLASDFSRRTWKQLGDGPVLKPELPWETKCIEAPSVHQRGDTLYLFYGGGYNNDPQQIGCAVSKDGVHFRRLFIDRPLLSHGPRGAWNSSESGHPGIFTDDSGQTYLFYQGNNNRGHTYYLSCVRIGWEREKPFISGAP